METFFERLDEKGNIIVRPELLSIKEFSELWERDKSTNKEMARKELTYIWALCSRNKKENLYYGYANKEERHKIILEDLFGNKPTWKPDEAVKQAVIKYLERNPKTVYEEERESADRNRIKIQEFLDNLDLNERDPQTNKLIFNPKMYQDMIARKGEIIKTIKQLDELIEQDREASKIKGGGEEGYFDNPDDAKEWLY